MTQTTCQICGRAILAKTGRISHHGYKRPGAGWQTASCYGARHAPYEVARDAIQSAIANCQGFIARTETRIADFLATPPAEMKDERRDAYGRVRHSFTLIRPEGFNPQGTSPGSYKPGGHGHYDCLFHGQLRDWRAQVAAAHEDIAFMAARYDAWVAPEPRTGTEG